MPTDSDVSEESEEGEDAANEVRGENVRRESGRDKKRSYSINMGEQSDQEKKRKGQITTDENTEEVRVDFQVYKDYLGFTGGWKQLFCTHMALALFTISKVSGDYLVGSWTISPDQHSRYAYYCTLYFTFTCLTSIFVGCRVASLMYFSWHGTKKLHEQMVARVLNAPINLYFDTTPIGRILNRFSKDLSILDVMLVYLFGSFYVNVYQLLAIVVMSTIIVPWIAIFFPIIFCVVIKLYRHSIDATKEVSRIESVTKSPLLSFLAETLSGSSTIRAYQKKDEFIETNYKFLNNNIVATQWSEAVPFWFAIRIDLVAITTMTAISMFCVLFRNKADPVMLAMLLTYSLTV